MKLAFESKRIRDICEDNELAKELYSNSLATNLRKRLADLESASSIYDLPFGNVQLETNDQIGNINLSGKFNLQFSANHVNNPMLSNGRIDWNGVNRIKILKINSYE